MLAGFVMAVGMDVDVAAVEFLRTFGSARRAEWFPADVGWKVLRWNVSGKEFLSQFSLLETGVLKLGMTDFFNLGELIQDQNEKGANEQCVRELCT